MLFIENNFKLYFGKKQEMPLCCSLVFYCMDSVLVPGGSHFGGLNWPGVWMGGWGEDVGLRLLCSLFFFVLVL